MSLRPRAYEYGRQVGETARDTYSMQLDLYTHGAKHPFARGSHTSWKAARAVEPGARASKTRRYLELLGAHATLTDPEVADLTGWLRSSICAIRNGLEQALLVTRSGQERRSQHGRDCNAYRLTDAGRAALAALRET